jgi:hypothetical protein
MKKAPQTLFGMQIRSNKEAHKLMIALNMVGLNVNIPACRLIIKAQDFDSNSYTLASRSSTFLASSIPHCLNVSFDFLNSSR